MNKKTIIFGIVALSFILASQLPIKTSQDDDQEEKDERDEPRGPGKVVEGAVETPGVVLGGIFGGGETKEERKKRKKREKEKRKQKKAERKKHTKSGKEAEDDDNDEE
ncbi:MAG TPA: hypothetical protein VEK38_01755 [Candidatus Bathyarchaeia archaeon]|nr:hypothetical protein [Candidatus Bathyarchaeia archaeon]